MNPTQFYKCLADDTRLRCLLMISQEKELCVCELTEALQESQPKVSRHLAQLRQCGLLTDRRQGKWVFYRLNPDLSEWCAEVLHTTYRANETYLHENLQRLTQMGDRPERAAQCC